MKRIVCVFGTRPEVIKMAPVIRSLQELNGVIVETLCSGQHGQLLLPILEWFDLRVDDDLEVMSLDNGLSQLTARLLERLDESFRRSSPDLVIAQGDTTTVMCTSLACFYRNIPFAHVEAGLRTFDLRSPFPEELNRVIATRTAALNFCPTSRARENLLAENVAEDSVHVTGNTVIDALQFSLAKLGRSERTRPIADILVTAHRRENFGKPLAQICEAIKAIGQLHPHLRILYPVHPNPNVRRTVEQTLSSTANVSLAEPLSYPDLVAAMNGAKLILTDSGGIQEEAPALGKPVLVVRDSTERPEAVELGLASVVGTDVQTIVAETHRLLTDTDHYRRMARGGYPYGDGRAAERIRNVVAAFLR
jgi:UDP-N-acetylglucosamine 2-epimerase (non-hydrolysing)